MTNILSLETSRETIQEFLRGCLEPLCLLLCGWSWEWVIWMGMDDMGEMGDMHGEFGIYGWNGGYELGHE